MSVCTMGSIAGTVPTISERKPPNMRPSKKAIYTGFAAAGLLAGAAGLSAAASSDSAPAAVSAQADPTPTPEPAPADTPGDEVNEANEAPEDEAGEQNESPAYTSSVTVDEAVDGVSEADENAALAPLATITADQATATASASQAGSVVSTQLENENGNVVFAVLIDTGNGMVDVKVDAGDGTVLSSDSGDDGEEGEDNADDEAGEIADDTPSAPTGG